MKRRKVMTILMCTVAIAAGTILSGCSSDNSKETEKVTEAPAVQETQTEEETAAETQAVETEAATEAAEEETELAVVDVEEVTTEAAEEETELVVEETTEAAEEETELAAEEATEAAEEETELIVEEETETAEEVTEAVEEETETAEEVTEAVEEETEIAEEETELAEEETELSEDETENLEEDAASDYEEVERPDYTASDYVELGEYVGLTVEVEPITVTEEEIDSRILEAVTSDYYTELTEGTVEEGDIANIDYEGKKDDVAFDGGTAEGYDLEIGSGVFIDGFEDGLIGAEIGETVDLNLTFPEEYGNEELAGQDVVFTVTVNSVKRMPEIDDALAETISGGEFTTLAEYRESVEAELFAEKEEERESLINNDLVSQVAASSEVKDYPEELVHYQSTNMKNYYKSYAEMYGMEFVDFLTTMLGMTEEEFDTEVDAVVKENIPTEMYLKAIAETEGLELTAEEYEAKCQEYADAYGYTSVEDFVADYDEKEIQNAALQSKVLDFLKDNAEITEISEEETELAEEETELSSEAETELAEAETELSSEAETEE